MQARGAAYIRMRTFEEGDVRPLRERRDRPRTRRSELELFTEGDLFNTYSILFAGKISAAFLRGGDRPHASGDVISMREEARGGTVCS